MSDIHFQQGQTDLLAGLKENPSEESSTDAQIEEIKKRIVEFFNVKNIHFLFGSGTSCNSIPSMNGLFDKVKEVVDKLDEDVKDEFEAIVERIDDKKNLEEILGILYANKIYLDDYDDYETELKICDELIKNIEETIFKNINIDFKDDEAIKVLSNYQIFYRKLALRNKDLSRLNIFTTNNDLFNEVALDSLNIHYINGFGGGLNKFFNPALFNYTFSKRMDTSIEKFEPVENMVNLYKIHGSVNWIEDDSNSNSFFKVREVASPESFKGKNNILIYPTPTKQNKSLGSPYVELFREFQKKLLEPHSILFIIGYSFNDEHVNNVIYQALATNSTINVVILNDICDKEITKMDDNRIFRIWGEIDNEVDGVTKQSKIHHFEFIVKNILPNLDATMNQDSVLEKFIDFYNKSLSI